MSLVCATRSLWLSSPRLASSFVCRTIHVGVQGTPEDHAPRSLSCISTNNPPEDKKQKQMHDGISVKVFHGVTPVLVCYGRYKPCNSGDVSLTIGSVVEPIVRIENFQAQRLLPNH